MQPAAELVAVTPHESTRVRGMRDVASAGDAIRELRRVELTQLGEIWLGKAFYRMHHYCSTFEVHS